MPDLEAAGSGSRASAAPASRVRHRLTRVGRGGVRLGPEGTPYLTHVREAGIPVTVSAEPPEPPADADAVVSTAYAARVQGRSRAEFLPSSWRCAARSSSAAPTGDYHGCDDRSLPRPPRRRPLVPDRRRGGAARGNARAGEGGWSSRATSPTAPSFPSPPTSPSSRTSTSTTTRSSRRRPSSRNASRPGQPP